MSATKWLCLSALRGIALAASVTTVASAQVKPPVAPEYKESLFPPWSHGQNNPAVKRGLEFTVSDVDDMADFHGSLDSPKLVLFVGGNYFFAMAPLAEAFEEKYPAYRGRLFYVTIPPGLLVKAMHMGDTFTSGNMTFTVHPDVYATGRKKIDEYVADGMLAPPAISYISNDLTIMIPKGNPAHVHGLKDLGRPGIRLIMPNPAFEGVVKQIKASLTKAGGPKLASTVYGKKVADGTTMLTQIHHRQTPLFLMQGLGDAGVTWRSEALFQEQIGHPLAHVDIPAADNSTGIYGAALVRSAPHPVAGKRWLAFLQSPEALQIFKRYGFRAVR
jgi:ABC-type molybdate transport system substrate-binding protein